jgi:predicted AlkP superfamily phosphohydrolase/phosphomutase
VAGRALVIGLDGMPLTLLRQLADSGVMPRMRSLLRDGAAAELLAPVPEISSTSWASFLTGAGPARHGIYGFTDLRPGGYQVYFPNLADLKAPPIWEHAAGRGASTLCLNVPGTYPAPRIRGAIVSGFVAPSLDRAVQPARLAGVLRGLDYQIDVEVGDVARDQQAFLTRVGTSLRARARAFTHLLACEPWDLAIAVLTETDRLQHFLWNHVADPGSALHEPVLDMYREVDAAVDAIIGQADDDTDLFIVSDHGFGPATCQLHVNAWLRTQGWLAGLAQTPTLAAVDDRTRAFALDPARFYLHAKDRFPRGTLTRPEADQLAAELADALRRLRWRDGEIGEHVAGPAVMSAVYLREEIYDGPLAQDAPDVVAVPAAGVQLRGDWKAQEVTGPDILTGAHTRDNAVFWTSRPELAADLVDMADVAPTVLASLGIDPSPMDGRNLLTAGPPSQPRSPAHRRLK